MERFRMGWGLFRAQACALGLGAALAGADGLAVLAQRHLDAPWSAALLGFVGLLALPVALAYAAVRLAGPRDLVAWMVPAVPAAACWLGGYAGNLAVKARIVGEGGLWSIVGYADPFDPGRQFLPMLWPAAWVALVAWAGIGLKRRRFPCPPEPPAPFREHLPLLAAAYAAAAIGAAWLAGFYFDQKNGYPSQARLAAARQALDDPSSDVAARRRALYSLDRHVRGWRAIPLLSRTARTAAPPLNIDAAKYLVARGETGFLPQVVAALEGSEEERSAALGGSLPLASMLERVRDPAALPLVAPLSRHSSADVREGAVRALGNMHATEAVAPLAAALYDDSPKVRYGAIYGLATAPGVGSDFPVHRVCPMASLYERDEALYLAAWRSWAEARWAQGVP